VFSTKKRTQNTVYINYSNFAKDVKKGDRILIDDGKIALQTITSNNKDRVLLKVVFGGVLRSNKGVNLPNTKTKLSSLTTKDKRDLNFIVGEKIEWIALSFVRRAKDIEFLKKQIKKHKSTIKVVAKIEKPEAINNIDEIIEVTDAVMVARGDLGVELPLHKVPVYQKLIVEKCIKNSKPVVIATQMLESMTTNISATRA
jgi:pyruvate kinase